MFAGRICVFNSQAVTFKNEQILCDNNLSDSLYHSCNVNLHSCEAINLCDQAYDFKNMTSYLLVHRNISSLQAHLDEFNVFFHKFSTLPSIIFVSETCINVNPLFNINIPGYTFLQTRSPTKAGGLGTYQITLGFQ